MLIHDNNKLGDLIVLSSLYRELSNRGVKLSILTTETGKAFLSGNSRIHQFYIKKSNAISDVLALRKQLSGESFDIVLDPFETMPSFGHSVLLSGVRHSHILGFDKWYKRYYTVYHPHDEMLTAHMCTRASEIMRHFYGDERNEFDVSYDLPLPASVEKDVLDFIGDSPIIIINALGAKKSVDYPVNRLVRFIRISVNIIRNTGLSLPAWPKIFDLFQYRALNHCPLKNLFILSH